MQRICSTIPAVAAHVAPAAMNDYCWLVPEAGDAVVLTVVMARSDRSRCLLNMVLFIIMFISLSKRSVAHM
jgi:hypothetical protein